MRQSLQILHVIAELDGYGTAGQLRILMECQRAEGHQVQVLALAAERAVLKAWQERGIDCHALDRRWQFDPFTAWRLARVLRRSNWHVLHVWDQSALEYTTAVFPGLVSNAIGRPVIATLRKPSPSGRAVRLGRGVPTTIVAPTQRPDASHVIPPGIPTLGSGRFSRAQVLSEYALSPDAQLIAVSGRLTREKRIEEAIWCFELVRTLQKEARLLIFGDGPDRPRWERFARLVSDSSCIRFLGYRPDIQELLPHVDVYWHPGEEHHASLLGGLEAMAARVPVVVSQNATSSAVLKDQQTGYLVSLGDRAVWARRTLSLLENKALATKIGEAAAQSIADQFAEGTMTAAYRALYHRVQYCSDPLSSEAE